MVTLSIMKLIMTNFDVKDNNPPVSFLHNPTLSTKSNDREV